MSSLAPQPRTCLTTVNDVRRRRSGHVLTYVSAVVWVKLSALEGEREVLVTEHYVYTENGHDLTGEELDVLVSQLNRARLNTKWRELNRDIPLGTYVQATEVAFEGKRRLSPGEPFMPDRPQGSVCLGAHLQPPRVRC